MNEPDDIRDLLRAARPSGQDDADPAMQAAREAAARDPALAAKLAAERRTDAEIARAVRAVEPPAELEAHLLTALRAARQQTEPPPELETRVLEALHTTRAATTEATATSRRNWLAWAAAAVTAALAGGAAWWRQRPTFTLAALTARLTTIAREGVTLSLMSMDKAAVAAWLRDARAPRIGLLPPKLDALGRKGCHLYDIEGHPVSLECLVLANMQVLHLFTTPATELRDPPPTGQPPAIAARDGFTVGVWTREGLTLVLISEEPPATLQALLG